MGSLIKVVASSCRLPRCVISSSRALAATHHHQRCFFSTIINDDRHGFKNNLHRVRNIAVNRISSFVYENIINRFGLFIDMRTYSIDATMVKPLHLDEDDWLDVAVPMNGVISHENVRVKVKRNTFEIEGVVYDEHKATYHMYRSRFWLTEEDSYYLDYKMREIQAYFLPQQGGDLLLKIPKFNAEERMMNQKKDEAGEFLKLKEDAFIFDIKVNAAI